MPAFVVCVQNYKTIFQDKIKLEIKLSEDKAKKKIRKDKEN